MADKCPAQLLAFVDVAGRRVWLMERAEFNKCAQQHPKGRRHFYMKVEPEQPKARVSGKTDFKRFDRYLIERAAKKLFLAR